MFLQNMCSFEIYRQRLVPESFYQISKNNFFKSLLWETASVVLDQVDQNSSKCQDA